MEAVSFDLAIDQFIRMSNRAAILRRDKRPDVHTDKLVMFQTVQPARRRICIQDIALEVFNENGVRRMIENCPEQPLPLLQLVSVQLRLHERAS